MRLRLQADDLDRTLPRTEDSAERGFVKPEKFSPNPSSYKDLGKSDQLDHEDGDIADEGPGHRG